MGRPSLLESDPELGPRIVAYVARGNYLSVAAEACGIDRATLKRWQQWGRDGREPYATFSAALKAAKSKSEDESVERVRVGATGWQGAAWWLERSRPERWSSDRRMKHAQTKLTQARVQALVDFDAILAGATADELARIQEIVTSVRRRATGNAGGSSGAPPGE